MNEDTPAPDPTPALVESGSDIPEGPPLMQMTEAEFLEVCRRALCRPLSGIIESMAETMGIDCIPAIGGTLGAVFYPLREAIARTDYTGIPPKIVEFIEGLKAVIEFSAEVRERLDRKIITPPDGIIQP